MGHSPYIVMKHLVYVDGMGFNYVEASGGIKDDLRMR